MHVPHQTRCVYRDSLLSELHNSCSCLEERSKICNTTQKPQNFILSAFLKMHLRQECANPGRLVAGVTMLGMAGDYYLQEKYLNIKLRISSNVTTINHKYDRSEKITSELCDFCTGIALRLLYETQNLDVIKGFWNICDFLLYGEPILELRNKVYLHKHVSTHRPYFSLKSSLPI